MRKAGPAGGPRFSLSGSDEAEPDGGSVGRRRDRRLQPPAGGLDPRVRIPARTWGAVTARATGAVPRPELGGGGGGPERRPPAERTEQGRLQPRDHQPPEDAPAPATTDVDQSITEVGR